jgi:hypothetical protein
MQRTEMIVLVAGVTVGLGGGALGGFLACTACQAVAHRVLDHLDRVQYIDLGPPTLPRAAPLAPPASDQNLPKATGVVSGARA